MKTYLKVMEELGWPNVYFILPKQFEHVEGDNVYMKNPDGTQNDGISSDNEPVFTLRHNLRGKALKNVIIHEVLHKIQPWRPHWWIECAAEKLAGGGGRGWYSQKYKHSPDDLPPKEELLRQVRNAVRRYNKKRAA